MQNFHWAKIRRAQVTVFIPHPKGPHDWNGQIHSPAYVFFFFLTLNFYLMKQNKTKQSQLVLAGWLTFFSLFVCSKTVKPGQNTIERRSTESSVTIPYESTFRNLDLNRPGGGDSLEQFNFCGCGWPQHMLCPKGSREGFPMELFVMISDYKDDEVLTSIDLSLN